MSSILTNNSAMVALQTLKGINNNLSETQSMISTGKSVASAKDNSAVWAISKVMESDVKGFKAISDSLSLGSSTVAVARNASETVTELLTDLKGKIVASQEENVDRAKIQTDIEALRSQIGSVVGAAQFNGLNLLENRDATLFEDNGNVNILSSLDRSATGVAASDIAVGKQDLSLDDSTTVGTMGNDVISGTDATVGGGAVAFATITWTDATIEAGMSLSVDANSVSGADSGDVMSSTVDYVARDGDTLKSVTDEMVARLNQQAISDGFEVVFTASTTTIGLINYENLGTVEDLTQGGAFNAADETLTDGSESDGVIGGGLELLNDIDVSTDDGASAALSTIEHLIQKSIDSAAAFGSVQGRIETQTDFISKLSDSLKSGIGTLVDADMEEASAKLQALQVQQQLAIQSLSIANQAPQSILSLFR